MDEGSGDKKQLGKILLKQRLVSASELDDLLGEQKSQPGQRLASSALASGRIDAMNLLKALSEQHGVPGIDLRQIVLPLSNLSLIPAEIARQQMLLPIVVRDDRVIVAMADPSDRRILEELEFVTGRRVFPYVALHDELREVIDRAYLAFEQGQAHYVGPNAPPEQLAQLGLAPSPSAAGTPAAGFAQPPPLPGKTQLVVDGFANDDLGLGELLATDTPAHGIATADLSQPGARLPGGPRTKPVVLVVDDEEDIRRLLRRVLTQDGYDVVEASRGIEALQAVRDVVPDVIVLDAMLPEVHGFDICRRIRGSRRYGKIPVIMLSAIYRGWRFAEDVKAAYGVEIYFEKPFRIADVLAGVRRVLEGRDGASEPMPDPELSGEAEELLRAGMDAYKRGDIDTAIAKLSDGIRIDPLSFKLHYHLGLLHGRKDQIFEAIHELETAVDLQPRTFAALKNLAVLYQRAGFRHKSTELWERALAVAPDDDTRKGIREHLMSLL